MTTDRAQTVNVDLPLSFVHALLTMRHLMSDELMAALETTKEPVAVTTLPIKSGGAIKGSVSVRIIPTDTPKGEAAKRDECSIHFLTRWKYKATLLEQCIGSDTLAGLFAKCVDEVQALAPEAIEELALFKTHARFYVAKSKDGVHFKTKNLPVKQCQSGWWVSANIKQDQLITAIKKLAEAAGLQFGKDIIFPIPADQK